MSASNRHPSSRRPGRGAGRRLRTLGAAMVPLLLAAALGACTESLETTAACPDLCPEQGVSVLETELQPVVLDTTLAAYPLRGQEPRLLVAGAGDSLDVRGIVRFDNVPQFYRPASGDSVAITEVIDPTLQLLLVRAESKVPAGGVTLQAYDVDAPEADTAVAGLAPLFTPSRLLGSITVVPPLASDTTTIDTLRLSLSSSALLAKTGTGAPLRIGLRVSGTPPALLSLSHSAQVTFKVSADTAIAGITLTPVSNTPVDDELLRGDLASFPIVVKGSAPVTGPVITVGGLPARRSLLRFAIPSAILDSSRIIQATLVLTQRPVQGYGSTDTLVVRPLPVTASSAVTDIDRLVRLAANPTTSAGEIELAPSVAVVPSDSGQKLFVLANLVSLWSGTGSASLQPLLVLEAGLEGATPLQAAFFSTEAPASVRPLLRLRYVRRINFDLP